MIDRLKRCVLAVLMAAGLVVGASQAVLAMAQEGQGEDGAPPDEEVQLEPDPIYLPNPQVQCDRFVIFFGHGESGVEDQYQITLDNFARYCPFSDVMIAGNADRSGPAAYNIDLSYRRAAAAQQALLARGFPSDAISIQAMGESRPLVDTADAVRELQNRRAEISGVRTLPEFRLPAPTPSERYSIPRAALGGGLPTLARVDLRLRRGLSRGGYRQPTYLAVRDGFAMVVRMERRLDDGGIWPVAGERWDVGPVPLLPQNAGILSRFSAAWSRGPSHAGAYRVYVFLVTTAEVQTNGARPSETETQAWLDRGVQSLPPTIGSAAFTAQHQVIALVYDFQRPTVSSRMQLVVPSRLDVAEHLLKSRILPLP